MQLNCCGVEGPQDYVHSSWFNHTRDLDGIFVPRSCCAPAPRRSVLSLHLAINENFCQVAAILYPASLNRSDFLFTQVTSPVLPAAGVRQRLLYCFPISPIPISAHSRSHERPQDFFSRGGQMVSQGRGAEVGWGSCKAPRAGSAGRSPGANRFCTNFDIYYWRLRFLPLISFLCMW